MNKKNNRKLELNYVGFTAQESGNRSIDEFNAVQNCQSADLEALNLSVGNSISTA